MPGDTKEQFYGKLWKLWMRFVHRCGKTPNFFHRNRGNPGFSGFILRVAVDKPVETGDNSTICPQAQGLLWMNYVYRNMIFAHFGVSVKTDNFRRKERRDFLRFFPVLTSTGEKGVL